MVPVFEKLKQEWREVGNKEGYAEGYKEGYTAEKRIQQTRIE